MRELTIAGRLISDSEPPYIIAEVGHNHGGERRLAAQMIEAAARAGVDAVKFQTRSPKDVYQANSKKGAYYYESDNPQWMDRVYGKHREKLEFSRVELEYLFDLVRNYGMAPISTPFDFHSADVLFELGMPVYKIASGDATNIPLITHVASFGKPVIVSTGGCTNDDVQRVYDAVHPGPLAILQCSCIYPAPDDVMNLDVIYSYLRWFPNVIGLSTHNRSWHTSLAAYALGARIFEHHFTIDKTLKGTDNHFSLDEAEMTEFVRACKSVRAAFGSPIKQPDPRELAPTEERRKSIVWATNLPAGHLIRPEDLSYKCPGDGIAPYEAPQFIGYKLANAVSAEELARWADIRAKVAV